MKKEIFFLVLVALFALSITIPAVSAQFTPPDLKPYASLILGKPVDQMPSDWFVGFNIIWYILLPFISIVAVIYGIMYDIRLFRNKSVIMVLSLAMAGMTLPTGWLIGFVYAVYSFNAAFAVVAFGVVFFVGILFWATGRFLGFGIGIVSEVKMVKTTYNLVNDKKNEINRIQQELLRVAESNDPDKDNKITKLKRREDELNAQIRELERIPR